jgi:hypothetical protein
MPLMVRTLAVVLALGLAVPLAISTAAADPLADQVAALQTDIEDVRILGTWENGTESGVYRVIVTRTGTANLSARMFVQWITYPPGETAGKVTATSELKELGPLATNITDYTFEIDPEMLVIHLQTSKADGSSEQPYVAMIRSPESYTFGPPSN